MKTALSSKVLSLLADHVDPDELAHVAVALRSRQHDVRRLPAEAVEELADMLLRGERPALGWWRRWRPPPSVIGRVGHITKEEVSP